MHTAGIALGIVALALIAGCQGGEDELMVDQVARLNRAVALLEERQDALERRLATAATDVPAPPQREAAPAAPPPMLIEIGAGDELRIDGAAAAAADLPAEVDARVAEAPETRVIIRAAPADGERALVVARQVHARGLGEVAIELSAR
ncbi:hypothetical protein [Haliangium sp.]|uniref:hypothetical protein n=1 Tax=Haliangium sp. TaxID=2663208 RepID=UPI003D12C699